MMPEPVPPCYAQNALAQSPPPGAGGREADNAAMGPVYAPMPLRSRSSFLVLAAAPLLGPALAAGCGPSNAPSPFGFDAGLAEDGGAEGGLTDAPPEGSDPELGGPCVDDGQCDDGVACTFDECDEELARCRFSPDDSACQNTLYCDGVERCFTKLGCGAGVPVGCSDPTPCTIDACDEVTDACVHLPRDADQDGDIDGHCSGGKDCDDGDPSVSSLLAEVCGNGKDDNCNKAVDEAACAAPQHDTCADPLEITAPGSYSMTTAGASFHYATSCAPGDQAQMRDVVAAVVLPAGPPVDVEITARTAAADVSVALAGLCGDASSEIACGPPFPAVMTGKIAKLLGRGLGDPAKSAAYPLYVTTTQITPVTLDVAFLPAEPPPSNETCGTASTIQPGVPVKAQVIDAAKDLGGACETELGELVYAFELTQASNVDVYAASLDGDGLPMLSLRGPGCALPEDEVVCQAGPNAHVFWQSLPAGTYYVAVGATAPTTALVTLEVSGPTAPAPDDMCATAPPLAPNTTIDVSLAGHQDDSSMCQPGMVDAAYALDLTETSDVLLVERISQGDIGAVALAEPACGGKEDQLVCGTGSPSPVRAAKHAVPAGSYRVVAESFQGQPLKLTAFVRPAVAPTIVPFSDGCADALEIPPEGGFFQGTTANAAGDYSAGCDQGGVEGGGAPDQMLKLVLAAPKRVVLEMAGSAYSTLLDVRKGPACPGTEIAQGCGVGFSSSRRSFLDLDLEAGVYFIQIDGYALDAGPWFLDVRVVDQ